MSKATVSDEWREARRRSARDAIVDAAWELVHDEGLAALSLRDLAKRAGITTPTIYAYLDSKNAIYDAMFGQAWTDYLTVANDLEPRLSRAPRVALKQIAHSFFDFAVADLARHQLMNQRTISGFTPSPESYAPAVEVLDRARTKLAQLGVASNEAFDIYTALVGGLIDAQQANDPGGDRWARLLDQAVDMFADHAGLPGSRRRSS